MGIPGSDLMEVPTIYMAYDSGLNFRGCTSKVWPKLWYERTSILGSCKVVPSYKLACQPHEL